MHLTFVSSDGLEKSAMSFLAATGSESLHAPKVITSTSNERVNEEFLVVDENSPLLLHLNPIGTRTGFVETRKNKLLGNRSLLLFRNRKKSYNGIPWVIIFTSV